MTAGYYFGGGIWVCWLHTVYDRVLFEVVVRTKQKMQAIPQNVRKA